VTTSHPLNPFSPGDAVVLLGAPSADPVLIIGAPTKSNVTVLFEDKQKYEDAGSQPPRYDTSNSSAAFYKPLTLPSEQQAAVVERLRRACKMLAFR
jgi:hypothetical protein